MWWCCCSGDSDDDLVYDSEQHAFCAASEPLLTQPAPPLLQQIAQLFARRPQQLFTLEQIKEELSFSTRDLTLLQSMLDQLQREHIIDYTLSSRWRKQYQYLPQQ